MKRSYHLRDLFLSLASLACFAAPSVASETDAARVFNQRILPIFQSENPSSCVQCHLSSVDLKNYILPSSDATFASLRDQGLINLDDPEKSKILELIRMGEKDLDEGAKLIHSEMRTAELAAFSEWVKVCSQDERLRNLSAAKELARPPVPDAVIRHARKSRVVDSFVRQVWSQRMRCFPCHTPDEKDLKPQQVPILAKKREEFAEQYDAEALKRLAIFRQTPEATLAYWVEDSKQTPDDRLPLLNLETPTESLLLQKPMSKVPTKKEDGTFAAPSYQFPISHMGGLKLHKNDAGYKSIVFWLRDYARVVEGEYKSVDELPEDNWLPTQLTVQIKNTPEEWKVLGVAQLFVHEWDKDSDAWNDEPIAFTQGLVAPRKHLIGPLFLLGTDEKRVAKWKEKPSLPRGRYLVKAYYDSKGKVEANPTAILSNEDYYGEAEIEKARWRTGFKFREVVPGKSLTKP